ncbi:flagellar hook-associated protein FlgK [Paragemmobacter ruber]|uniref:Flagellar hook-associated protein 1 n=1 Tax=Paragemmobacter ruber TaxID=1985673 RepID=A0ABW9Y4P0_9RHOB|nr:flagellar hook-associated protein FlgK [Rhodobacter ruber]NBE07362.1 flagellar hook-associated protein FlgK [Rhodobacter ruber]
MALSSALSAALSGLTITSRRAETVSSNIANAATPGYGRREVVVQPDARAPGVQMIEVRRQSDMILTTDRRSAGAAASAADYLSGQLLRLERAYGAPGEAGSLTDTIAALDSALITAAATPDSGTALTAVADAAKLLARRFGDMSDMLTNVRAEADAGIADDVSALNTDLSRIADLDRKIVAERASGRDASSMIDQRQQIVDRVAALIPLREVPRPDGRSALISLNGAVLLDGRPAVFGFTPTAGITASGPSVLSGLTLNGQAIGTGPDALVSGGMLSARFALRDTLVLEVQAGLDALALDIGTRLSAADATLGPASAGLLTDAGALIDAGAVAGLSARLALNTIADLDAGGDIRFIRDGLGAAQPGPVGESRQLLALQAALANAAPISVSGRASSLVETLSTRRIQAEEDASRTSARANTLSEAEAAKGVNTDSELQDLLQIEKAYAANARVLQVVDGLLQNLLEI